MKPPIFVSLLFPVLGAMAAFGFAPAPTGTIEDSVGRAGMIAVFVEPSGEHVTPAIVLAGGANFPYAKPNAQTPAERGKKVFYSEVTVLPHTVASEANEPVKPLMRGSLPRPLGYAAYAATPQGVVIAGGCNEDGHLAKASCMQLRGNELRTEALPDLPVTVAYPAFALVGSKVYVIGGQEKADSTTCLSSCFALDLNDIHAGWKEMAPMPGGRMLAGAGVVNGLIYVVGGCSLSPNEKGEGVRTYLSEVLCYDPGSNSWARVASDMPETLVGMASPLPVSNGKLYVVGGDPGAYYRASLAGQPPAQHPGQSKNVYSFAPATGEWVKEGELRQGVATLPAVVADGVVYTFSGETHPGVRTPLIDAFTVDK